MPIVTIKTKGQITIPAETARALKLAVGDLLELSVSAGKIVLTPKQLIDRPQSSGQKRGKLAITARL